MKIRKEEPVEQHIIYSSDNFKILVIDGTVTAHEKAFHESIEIKYFYEGRSMMLIGSEMISAESGDITIVNPYEIHANVINDAYKGKYCLMIVGLDFFADTGITDIDLRQLLLVKRHRFNHCIKNNKRLQQLVLSIKEELNGKKEYYRLIVANLLSEFFALLMRDEIDSDTLIEAGIDGSHQSDVIAPALLKIFRDYRNRITVDELAGLCNISKYHFCRIFKKQLGVTVTQYILNYRLSLAETMLKDEKQSIKQIASTCGFDDISYFYRCYKRIKGTSPNKARSI